MCGQEACRKTTCDAVGGARLERPPELERRAEAQVDVAVAVAGVELQRHAAARGRRRAPRSTSRSFSGFAESRTSSPARARAPRRGRTRRGPRPCRPATTPRPERYAMIDFRPAAPASSPAPRRRRRAPASPRSEVASAEQPLRLDLDPHEPRHRHLLRELACGTTTSRRRVAGVEHEAADVAAPDALAPASPRRTARRDGRHDRAPRPARSRATRPAAACAHRNGTSSAAISTYSRLPSYHGQA